MMPQIAVDHSPTPDKELTAIVGQLFIVGFDGLVPDANIRRLITEFKVGTIILFSRNIENENQLRKLTSDLQRIAKSAGHKQDLLIAIDQENGLVTRIKSPIAIQLPGSMALGATRDPENAYQAAFATAEMLKSFGIHMNYAPVADVNSEPRNPVIGVRSFSDEPETVGQFVAAQLKGFQRAGVIPCVKHFPGHGDTAVDSHFGLPVINKLRSDLEACELIPFRRAVAEGVDAMMTAHIVIPAIGDSEGTLPASLSPAIVRMIRGEMKYQGLIITDCLEMDGVRGPFGTANAAVRALKAGNDCVMVCHNLASQLRAIERVVEAVNSGQITRHAVQTSAKRVRSLKKKYLILDNCSKPNMASKIEAPNVKISELASRIYAQSTTLIRSSPSSLPWDPKVTTAMVFLYYEQQWYGNGAVESGEGNTKDASSASLYTKLINKHIDGIITITYHENTPLTSSAKTQIDQANLVILTTRNASQSPFQKELGLSLGKQLGEKLVVIATCDPYDFLEESQHIKNYISTYEPTLPAFKSAIDIIFGDAKPQGTLPVGGYRPAHEITQGSRSDLDKVWHMWQYIFSDWAIDRLHLQAILSDPSARLYIHDKGFCIAFFVTYGVAKVAIIGVVPNSRKQGVGTALVKHTRESMNLECSFLSFGTGSVFPRLWPGVPTSFAQSSRDFFIHRGFRKSIEPTARDLYKDITTQVVPKDILNRISKLPFKFSPWSKGFEQECLAKQRANFKNIGWVEAYENIAAANQHHEVMVAFDEQGEQVGWTLMCSQNAAVTKSFAFMKLLPAKEKAGLIGCVGVDCSARGKGIGLALLVRAMENMKQRGIEGVFIDWVVIRGFYEKLEFEPIWEYEDYEW